MPYDDDWTLFSHGKGPSMRRFTPRVKGKRRLDIGWAESGDVQPGSTLGVDIQHEDSSYIQERIDKGDYEPTFQHIEASGTHLPYKTGSIDAVTSDHALGMELDPYEGLSEAIRVLRPGGKLYVRYGIDIDQSDDEVKEIKEWLKAQPVTRVRFSPEPKSSWNTVEKPSNNWILRFTKL